jgi:hypothetical protein
MTDKRIKAYALAKEAAQIHFEGAMQGLMAGHAAALEEIQSKLASKDLAFLMALSLTEKGRRIDSDGIMVAKICEGLRGVALCETERKFIAAHETQGNKP